MGVSLACGPVSNDGMAAPTDLPTTPDGWAFFLDLDGTLIDIAERPDAVVVPPELPGLLVRLASRAGGALALVSGRAIATLDRLLAPARLPAAGIHGAEMRFADGGQQTLATAGLDAVRLRLSELAALHPELLVEDKGVAIAVHYRLRPELRAGLEAALAAIVSADASLDLQPGKMVFEVRPAGADKGRALARFLETPPFAGRRPLAIGDDLSDEPMFRAAADKGGLAVRIGADQRETAAAVCLNDTQSLRSWLSTLAADPR